MAARGGGAALREAEREREEGRVLVAQLQVRVATLEQEVTPRKREHACARGGWILGWGRGEC